MKKPLLYTGLFLSGLCAALWARAEDPKTSTLWPAVTHQMDYQFLLRPEQCADLSQVYTLSVSLNGKPVLAYPADGSPPEQDPVLPVEVVQAFRPQAKAIEALVQVYCRNPAVWDAEESRP
jgi:hypothetical protein